MKRSTKRILALAMALILALSIAVPVFAADGTVTPETGTQTTYMTSKNGSGTSVWVSLATGSKKFTIKRSDVKVSAGTAGAKLYAFEKNYDEYGWLQEYDYSGSGKWETNSSDYVSYSYEAGLRVSSAGKATVSYKIGSKSYKTTVKVLNYVNPVKSITLKGVNGSKSFASLTKEAAYTSKSLKLTADTKSAVLKVSPTKGWKITRATFEDETDGISRSIYSYNGKGMSSVSLSCGNLKASHTYWISVQFRNSSNGATLSVQYRVNY